MKKGKKMIQAKWFSRATATVGAVALVLSQYESMLPPWGRKLSAGIGGLALLLTTLGKIR